MVTLEFLIVQTEQTKKATETPSPGMNDMASFDLSNLDKENALDQWRNICTNSEDKLKTQKYNRSLTVDGMRIFYQTSD